MSDTSAQHDSEFRGDLARMPLPEVLLTVYRHRVPGVIDCSRDGVTKRIFIDSGDIIFATSDDVADSLGDRLLAAGTITIDQYRESVRRLVKEGGKRQGSILVEMRAIEPKELFVAVREQVQTIVWSTFDWDHGDVAFYPGRDRHTEFIKLNFPIPDAVLFGIAHVRDPKRLVARIGNKTTVLKKTIGGDSLPVKLDPLQQEILESIDGRRTLYELTASGLAPPTQIARNLYALFALGLIGVKPQRQVKVQVRSR